MWKVAKAFKVSIKWENGSRPTIQVNRKPSLHTFLLSLSQSQSLLIKFKCNTTTG